MKTIIYRLKTYISLVFLLSITTGFSQIVLNPNPNTNTCNLDGDTVTVSVPSEALTGDNIPLNITLPGSYDAACVKSVSITPSSNLVFQSSGAIPFSDVGGGIYQNDPSPTLNGNDGHNFNVFFKFPGFITCDGDVGNFDVTVTLDCGGEISTCTIPVSVIARADNYWSVTKEYITGNLTCGVSQWLIKVQHNNPNGSGLGTYSLNGTLTENPSVPVVNGATHNISYSGIHNTTIQNQVTLQNCSPEGSTVTNSAEYNFSIGGGCETMTGTVTAESDPLISPNADLSFSKDVRDNNGYSQTHPYFNLSPGCSGRYSLRIENNGNVPWTNIEITDNLTIPGITITNIYFPSGWTSNPTVTNPPQQTAYTFTAPSSFTLNPGEIETISVYFDVNSGTSVGTNISNTANLTYNAVGNGSGNTGSGGGTSPCPGINCPVIDTSIQNTTATVNFEVTNPEPNASIKKCIINPPNAVIPPIYQIGDTIEFSVMIGNSGSADLTTTVSDALGMPNQNLQIDTGNISYEYYEDESRGWRNSCNPNFGASSPLPFTPIFNGDSTNPEWQINDMPGICDYKRSNFLIIKFTAEVLPQLYGTKTNEASIPHHTGIYDIPSAVNYTIDQVGVLGVYKEADAEFVEDGQSFNYEITLSNNGSVPLDNIVVTDMLPDCVSLNGQLSIEDDFATSIPFTTSGSLTININPTTELVPGNDFTITIPVTKPGSGTCCNDSVSVTADMVTSGVELNANYGSEESPAACVTGTECCDIDDFDASIEENNGTFDVMINGGSVPLQEVEISMVDYHIEYAEEDCKPNDLGVFGTLNTSTTNLGNLILNSGDNGTSSLTWLLGNPSVINSSVNLDIINPEVLNLECCDVEFYFCLKVKVKNVNCDDCETIVCYSSNEPPEPCEIDIRPLADSYCAGDTVNLNWTSSNVNSGDLNIYFMQSNGTLEGIVATGVQNSGSYQFTIPEGIECDTDKQWYFYIGDKDRECYELSNLFTIKCCDQGSDCECGEWSGEGVTIKGYEKKIPRDPREKINVNNNFETRVDCGDRIELEPTMNYTFTAPDYICNPKDCDAEYKWEIVDEDGTILSGNGQTLNYTFNEAGYFEIIFTPICGGKKCDPCVIEVIINKGGGEDPHDPSDTLKPRKN